MKIIEIHNVAVPVWENIPEYFVAPDLEPAFDYYPNFLRHSEVKLSPIQYMYKLAGIFGKTGAQRTQILSDYSYHVGAKFRYWLKDNNELFEQYSATINPKITT